MMEFTTIADMFLRVCNYFPEKDLLFHKTGANWIGFPGIVIKNIVSNICFGLVSAGIKKGCQVAILSENSPHWAMCDYAIACSGAASVSIFPKLIPAQLEHILEDSHSELIFIENETLFDNYRDVLINDQNLKHIILIEKISDFKETKIISLNDFIRKGIYYSQQCNETFENLIDAVKPDDLLTLNYAFGIEGNPKGVELTHKNLVSNITAYYEKINITQDDRFLSYMPLNNAFERMAGYFTPFSMGASIYYVESINTMAANVLEIHPTIIIGTLRLFEKIKTKIETKINSLSKFHQKFFNWAISLGADYSALRLTGNQIPFFIRRKYAFAKLFAFRYVYELFGGKLRFFISDGSPLSREITEYYCALDVPILEGYGLAEASPVITSNSVNDMRFDTVGKPLNNVKLKLGIDDEILIKGPNIMAGYFNNEDATRQVIDKDGWFHTGDIGEIDADGFLMITGRKNNLIVTSTGKSVPPAPIEEALVKSSYIKQAVVLGENYKFISAIIVPDFKSISTYLNTVGKSISEPEALIEHVDVVTLIENEVERIMEKFSKHERVKKFCLLSHPFTIENGQLLQPNEVNRNAIFKQCKELIDNIYFEGNNVK